MNQCDRRQQTWQVRGELTGASCGFGRHDSSNPWLPADPEAVREWVLKIAVPDGCIAVREDNWDPAKHPRGAFPENPGWFSPVAGASSASTSGGERRQGSVMPAAFRTLHASGDRSGEPNSPPAEARIDKASNKKTWSGQYGAATGRKRTATFRIRTSGIRVTSTQEQEIADAVVEAVDRFAEVYDLLKNHRAHLKQQFPGTQGTVGRMVHDDESYEAVLANMERVMDAIERGELVLEADPNYKSENEPVFYTNMNRFTYNARREMRYTKRLLSESHAAKWKTLCTSLAADGENSFGMTIIRVGA